jgi:guanyl-specific ribonuclease Sa
MFNRRRITAALIGLIVLVLGGWLVQNVVAGDGKPDAPKTSSASASPGDQGGDTNAKVAGADSGLAVKPLSSLPPEAASTWKLIQAGGPYPYPHNDDVVFGNREKLLPLRASGYYKEFTVATPGSTDRGARRLITGQARELFYTGDHYVSFVVVDPGK